MPPKFIFEMMKNIDGVIYLLLLDCLSMLTYMTGCSWTPSYIKLSVIVQQVSYRQQANAHRPKTIVNGRKIYPPAE